MGVNIAGLLLKKEIDISDLNKKTIAIDASLFLYQFLTSIRQRDGSLLTDSNGNVTSHLVGLFSRTSKLIQKGIKPIYVFDGKPPSLKMEERKRRAELKKEAEAKYKIAVEKEDVHGMKKYAARTARLTPEMVEEAKTLLSAMGVPIINAPCEGEAQAALLAKNNDAYAVASQDTDSLMFGAPRLIRNLSIYGRKKVAYKRAYEHVSLELIELSEVLNELCITKNQFVALGMLVGTDYNIGGIKGIGPKNALKLVKKHKEDLDGLFNEVKWGEFFDYSWQEVYDLITKMKVDNNYKIESHPINKEKIRKILIEGHDFSEERIEKALESLHKETSKRQQKTLGDF